MAMVPGSVSVDGSGVASGAGFAKQMYDVLEAGTDFGAAVPPGLAVSKTQLAVLCNAAAKLIEHVATNSVVSTTDAGTSPIAWTGTGTGTVS